MLVKNSPRLVAVIEVVFRWFFFGMILAWGAVLAACVIQFARS